MPTYKDQMEKLKDAISRPMASSAIRSCRPPTSSSTTAYVPVGEDQAPPSRSHAKWRDASTNLYGARRTFAAKWLGHRQVPKDDRAIWRSNAAIISKKARPKRWPRAKPSWRKALQAWSAGHRRHRAAAGDLRGTGKSVLTSGGCSPGEQAARPRRREDEQELWQHHRHAQEPRGGTQDQAHAHRSGALHRSDPGNPEKLPGVAVPSGVFRRAHQGRAGEGVARRQASVAWTANSLSSTPSRKSRSRGANAPRPTSRTRSRCTGS